MHTRLLRVIHARHLGTVLQVAYKSKRIHVALAVVHLPHASDVPLAGPLPASGAIRRRRAMRMSGVTRLCVVHELSTLEHAPVASPQHAARLHFRLRHVDVETAVRRGA